MQEDDSLAKRAGEGRMSEDGYISYEMEEQIRVIIREELDKWFEGVRRMSGIQMERQAQIEQHILNEAMRQR